jgi:glutamine synthetase
MTDFKKGIAEGKLAKLGLFDKTTIEKSAALLETVEKRGLETIRVLFADQHGILRGKTIVASAFSSVFTTGIAITSTLLLKDTANKTVFPVWSKGASIPKGLVGASDILLVPDANSFRTLPWSPHSAWIFCNAHLKTGEPISFSPRHVLQHAIDKLAANGKALMVGLEVEFQVFEITDPMLDHASATMPGKPVKTRNLAQGFQFLSETRYGEMETIIDELRRNCEGLKLPIRSMEIEMGPSQLEFTFDPANPMTHADNMMMLRAMVKEVCARKGLHATFMCKPNVENAVANGWHLHQSLVDIKTGANLMIPETGEEPNTITSSWIAGLLEHAAASCLLTTPTVNGYKRYQPHQLAPDRIQWGRDNRGAMIRALLEKDNPASRIENRVAETTANPYYFFASQILSGLDGLERGLKAPEPSETPYDSESEKLPESLLSAIQHFEGSAFYRKELGDEFVDYLSHIRRSEWNRYHLAVSEWEQTEYFGLY